MTRSTYCGAENPSKEKDLGDAGKPRCYPEVQIDDWVLRYGDLVYCTPPAKGDFMEVGLVEGLFVGKDEDGEDTQMAYLRWFWCAQKMKHSIKDAHAREIFISDVYDACPLEVVEGCAGPV